MFIRRSRSPWGSSSTARRSSCRPSRSAGRSGLRLAAQTNVMSNYISQILINIQIGAEECEEKKKLTRSDFEDALPESTDHIGHTMADYARECLLLVRAKPEVDDPADLRQGTEIQVTHVAILYLSAIKVSSVIDRIIF